MRFQLQIASTMSFAITVVFPTHADSNYNIDYYVSHHMPLIERHWKKFGLKSWSVTKFAPGLDGNPPLYAFGSVVSWENEEGMKEAFGSPEAAEIMGDVPNFSNVQPIFLLGQILKAT